MGIFGRHDELGDVSAVPTEAGHISLPTPAGRKTPRWSSVILALAGTTIVVVIWQLGVSLTGSKVLPGPVAVARGIGELAHTGRLFSYAIDSLVRVGTGFSLALVTGLPLGLAMGWFPWLGSAVNPLIQLLRPISPLAWIPLAVVALGIGNAAPIFLIFIASFCVIVETAMNGIRMVPQVYTSAARNFGLSRAAVFRRAVLPAALPQVLNGVRIALGVSWVVVVAAEMIAVNSGLGYLIIDARNAGKRYDLVIGGMVLIGGIGLLLDTLVLLIERLRVVSWGFHARG
jgi:NitT/TauT family transport system permease protein